MTSDPLSFMTAITTGTVTETSFKLASYDVIPGWLMLMFFPRHNMTVPVVRATVVINCAIYALNICRAEWDTSLIDLSLKGIMKLFQSGEPSMIAAAWVHYLCFDMLAAELEVKDAVKVGIPIYLSAPCIFFTCVLGPIGWAMYGIVRLVWTGKLFLGKDEAGGIVRKGKRKA